MSILIREATMKDVTALINLRSILLDRGAHIYCASDVAARKLWRKNFTTWLKNHALVSQAIRVIAAERNNTVVGCAIGIVDHRAPSPSCGAGLSGWVQSVIIMPDYRGLGIAKELMHHLIAWLSDYGCKCIVLEATPMSIGLYESMGFRSNSEMLMTRLHE